MEPDLAGLISKKFIQQRAAKAIQVADGGYRPRREPWKMRDLKAHLAGEETFGHYMCDSEGKTKLFVLDIDLRKYDIEHGEELGFWVERPDVLTMPSSLNEMNEEYYNTTRLHPGQPREIWADRRHPGRKWYKYQLSAMVEILTHVIHRNFGLPTAAAYSGSKGAHVYGFTGVVDAADARALALDALEVAGGVLWGKGEFIPIKGKSFFRYEHNSGDPKQDWIEGFANLDIEVYPKQDSMEGKDLGNLVRLPLGVNKHSARIHKGETVYDPAFFIDQRTGREIFTPHNQPALLLSCGDPWREF